MAQEIPHVDLAELSPANPKRREQCAERVTEGLRDIGFIAVKTAEIEAGQQRVYDAFAEVFQLPEEELMAYSRPDIYYLRGYTELGAETALACRARPGKPKQPDWRSSWLIEPNSFSDASLKQAFPAFHNDNVWPEGYDQFREQAEQVYARMNNVGQTVLSALEAHLRYEPGYFAGVVTKDGNHSLRPLHYPPVSKEDAPNTIWGCTHTDANVLTVLPPSRGNGLLVKDKSGEWRQGKAEPGYSLVQVGDTLQYMTGGYFNSAVHKIVVPEQGSPAPRYSAPFFVYANHRFDMAPDPGMWPEADPRQYRPRTAGKDFEERLQRIGLASPDSDEAPLPDAA